MSIRRHLSNAPITEALVDIRVKLPPNIDVDKLKAMGELISDRYPKEQKRMRFEGQIEFNFKSGKPPEHKDTTSWIDGYMYNSEDGKYVVQVRLDGFTVSRLEPYETWENLRNEAFRLWEHYVKIASPEIITRVALRYINRLELPLSMGDFKEYLTSPPTVPKNLPQKIESFLMRVVIPGESIKAFSFITQPLAPIKNDGIPLILHIDAIIKTEYELYKKDAWNDIDKLHKFKNDIFFESITKKTKELYL